MSANLTFLPWVRQGVASAITVDDALGLAPQPALANLSATLSINGAAIPAMQVALRGPADVIGIDADQIVRMEPRPGSIDFEPNFFPCIEFDRADFPWLFTPARAASSRLRPWLYLVVIRKQQGVTLGNMVDAPLPVLQIASPARPADELPDLGDCWAWAHAQAAAENSDTALRAALDGAPELSLSRLICPRLLAADTDYIACVVPTFELGRKAGLGEKISDAELRANDALAPAWPTKKDPPNPAGPPLLVKLPVYHHWEFRTGAGGDFRSLVRRLRPQQPIPAGLGERPIDISRPGFGPLPGVPAPTGEAQFPAGVTLGLEGALQPMTSSDAPWSAPLTPPFQAALAAIVNTAGENEIADPSAVPLLAPPLYGRTYAAPRATVTPLGATWFDQVNLDPRWRAVASFGTRVVQEHQEALMAAAWEQAAQLQQDNQRLRQLQLSLAVGISLHTRHFSRLSSEAMVRIGAPAFSRIQSITTADPVPRPLMTRITASVIPVAATSPAMRRIGRQRGPLTRRIAAQGVKRSSTRTWLKSLNVGSFPDTASPDGEDSSFPSPPPFEIATYTHIRQRLASPTSIRDYSLVTAAAVGEASGRPHFRLSPEGPPPEEIRLDDTGLPDSPAGKSFREAAMQHLERIDPGRHHFMIRPAPPLAMDAMRDAVLTQTQPRLALVALARALVSGRTPNRPTGDAPAGDPATVPTSIDTVMWAPVFRQPMYEALRDLSQEWLLPGLEAVEADCVLGLKTNRPFVEAYMLGLNVEMARELLWRGFPTDQRGTCFNQFWDVRGSADRSDIGALHLWGDRPLGDARTAPTREQFVMLLRSALLRRYPNAVIYLTPARETADGARVPGVDPGHEILPAFCGAMPPDVSFFGFDLEPDVVTGADGTPGYYIVIQEHPTEPRFGLPSQTTIAGANYLAIAAGPPEGLSLDPSQWGTNAAHMAGVTRHLPVRMAIHASLLITPAPPAPRPPS